MQTSSRCHVGEPNAHCCLKLERSHISVLSMCGYQHGRYGAECCVCLGACDHATWIKTRLDRPLSSKPCVAADHDVIVQPTLGRVAPSVTLVPLHDIIFVVARDDAGHKGQDSRQRRSLVRLRARGTTLGPISDDVCRCGCLIHAMLPGIGLIGREFALLALSPCP